MKKLTPAEITVVFVPFFGGRKPSLNRHLALVESLGFKSRFVELEFSPLKLFAKPFSSRTFDFGMKAIWADKIEAVLNEIPGKKIIFAFSNPSSAAIEAIARRGGHDILGLICDGGPTGEVYASMMNYFKVEKPMPTWPLRAATSLLFAVALSPKLNEFCNNDLKLFPKGFKILSIRGWKDPLISPKQIDLIFEPHHQLDWRKFSVPKGEHLNGLKDFAGDYTPAVQEFLTELYS